MEECLAIPWTDKGRTLFAPEIKELLRDACASLGKCALDSKIATVVGKSPNALRFDTPPAAGRPDHQKRALSYAIVSFFHDANIRISRAVLPVDYFAQHAGDPLADVVPVLANGQVYLG